MGLAGGCGGVSFSLKFTTFNYSFNGFRMRTCYARPWIVYILSREDRLILRKESPAKFFFWGGRGFGWRPGDSFVIFRTISRGLFYSLKL